VRDSSEDRRLAAVSTEEILEVALQTFAEKGDEGTSVRDIARRLNVSHNLIPIRIGTKEELRCSSA
jgi:AcrR family transcriptional regulator